MEKKQNSKLNLWALAAFLLTGLQVNSAIALDTVNAQTAIDNGMSVLELQQNVSEGSWGHTPSLDYIYTTAAVEAFKTANTKTNAYYSGLAWLENHNAGNNDLKARKVMALVNRGNNIEPDLTLIHAAMRESGQGGWGLSSGYTHSPLESGLVLQALYKASDATNLQGTITYLLDGQRNDGGWATDQATVSNYWFTAEVVLALVDQQGYTNVSSSLSLAATYLATVDTATVSSSTLARVALALYKVNGLGATVDAQMTALMNKQISGGDWGDTLATANAVTTLAYGVGINPDDSDTFFEDVSRGRPTSPHTRLRTETEFEEAFEKQGYKLQYKRLHSISGDTVAFMKFVESVN